MKNRIRMAAVFLMATVAAGCSSGATTQPSASPVAVTDTHHCVQVADGTVTKVGDIDQYRGVKLSCEHRSASDPRVNGTQLSEVSIDQRPDGSADIWGTFLLTNEQGTWTGDWIGTVAAGYTTHAVDGVSTGTGDYAGLRYAFHVTGDGQDFKLTGTIDAAP